MATVKHKRERGGEEMSEVREEVRATAGQERGAMASEAREKGREEVVREEGRGAMMEGGVRTRYAPSPTGEQHIGGLRTALYNYLFARIHNGEFVVRIEDTDRARFQAGASERILEALAWVGVGPRESPLHGGAHAPYTQSERLPLYREHARRLIDAGRAYWAYDTAAELSELRERGRGYDGRGRTRSNEENEARRERGVAGVVRFHTPQDGESAWVDMVLGRVARRHADIACDPVLLKSDGYPTYHLASVVDDHAMRITHVLRAQEWLSSTPLHLLLYSAFGWTAPSYAHLPLITGADGKKLAKRHGTTAVSAFQAQGILPAALCNYIALLGWSPDDNREHFTLEELAEHFSIERVQRSAATFDLKKLLWHNGHYLREMTDAELLRAVQAALDADGGTVAGASGTEAARGTAEGDAIVAALGGGGGAGGGLLAEALRQRIQTAHEGAAWLGYLATTIAVAPAALLCGKRLDAVAAGEIVRCVSQMSDSQLTAPEQVERRLQTFCAERGLGFGHSMGVIRVALSGVKSSLPAQVMLATLPVTTIRQRLRATAEQLPAAGGGTTSAAPN